MSRQNVKIKGKDNIYDRELRQEAKHCDSGCRIQRPYESEIPS